MAESNEMVVSLRQTKDLYSQHGDCQLCIKLLDDDDKCSRQLYKLGEVWNNFKSR